MNPNPARSPRKDLLPDDRLEASAIVANCRMNRERNLSGSNGYDRELGFAPLEFLRGRARQGYIVRWLDLCCGTGRALWQATEAIEQAGEEQAIRFLGLDLVAMFASGPPLSCLRLHSASVHSWAPEERFDLITCVHGLHYLGDKLRVIERALSWLVEDGLFAANLRQQDGRSLARQVGKLFREAGLVYNRRRRLLTGRGISPPAFPLVYLGADDDAGPNYTGQAAVSSYYRPA